MAIKQTLGSLVLAGTLVLSASGCKTYSPYNYDGKIGEDRVKFAKYDYIILKENLLNVTKSDGRIISFSDSNGNLMVDRVETFANGKIIKYYANDKEMKPVIDKAQEQFDNYLKDILMKKAEENTLKKLKAKKEVERRVKEGLERIK